jgi:hypothetical protein
MGPVTTGRLPVEPPPSSDASARFSTGFEAEEEEELQDRRPGRTPTRTPQHARRDTADIVTAAIPIM